MFTKSAEIVIKILLFAGLVFIISMAILCFSNNIIAIVLLLMSSALMLLCLCFLIFF